MSVMDKMLEQIRLEEAASKEFIKLEDDNDKKAEDLFLEIIGLQAETPKKEVNGKKKISVNKAELKSYLKDQQFLLVYLKRMLAMTQPVFYEAHLNRIRSGLNEINELAEKYDISLD